ncbi:MAG: Do family serine endopeptidase [Pseudomonadota bacterium]
MIKVAAGRTVRPSRRSLFPRHGAGFLAAGAIGLSVITAIPLASPASAQLKPDDATVATPFGRAPLSFADIVEKVKPSVVSISVTNGEKKTVRNNAPSQNEGGRNFGGLPNLPDDHPLNEFFKNLPKEFKGKPSAPQQRRRPSLAQGSGFVISEDGYVVTNNHVIDGASEISVTFDKNNKFDAELVGSDPRTDLALLKIKSDQKFPALKFAEKPSRVGDWVVAVGNPFGLGGTVTAGILSAQGRDIGSGPYDYIQIDAAVNRGNSGGPTFNLKGEVIGVNTAIFSPSGGNVGIAFAVPARTTMAVVEQLRKDGTVSRGWLGVKIQNIDEDTAASLGLAKASGALVSEVTPNGPAFEYGIETQDAILTVAGEDIADSRDLARKIAEFSPGSTVDVGVWRDGENKKVDVKLGRFPSSSAELAALQRGDAPKKRPTELQQLGLALKAVGGEGDEDPGVRITSVDVESDAARKGLKEGDVILEVQGVEVASAEDVVKGIKRAKDKKRPAVLLHVQSGNDKRFVAVQLSKDKG